MSNGFWETVLASGEEATQPTFPTLSTYKRRLNAPIAQAGPSTAEKRARRFSKGHDYSQMIIQGNAKAHLGDHHVHVSGDYNYYAPSQPPLHDDEDKTAALIKWLQFPRQEARREQIEPAHQETFQWIFEEDKDLGDDVTNFAQWLRAGNGLYWINGKAGSGKSTLMRMLSDDVRTRQILNKWAEHNPLVLSSFYFWNLGTDMQRSILGLLRSLLCDVLEACPEVTDEAFPNWQSKFSAMEPTLEEVTSAFRRVVKGISKKICFLIDGLDEFEGDDIKKAELAKLIVYTVEQPAIKAVVSSRPLQVFKSNFQRWPCFAMHELTKRDVKYMVAASLGSSEHFKRLCRDEPWRSSAFIDAIARRSAGVFLWAVWAVKIILDGCLYEDTWDELDTKLKKVPEELDQLFRTMLLRIPHGYRMEAFRYFKTTLYWATGYVNHPLTCLELSLAASVEEASGYFWSGNFPSNYRTDKERRLRARLHSATQGLLEEHNGYVEFMHKSVVDFLRVEGELLDQTLAMHEVIRFDPPVAMLIAQAVSTCLWAQTKLGPRSNAASLNDQMADDFLECLSGFFKAAHLAETSIGVAQCACVDQLHRILRSCSFWDGNWDCEFFARVLWSECTLYIKEKLRSHETTFLEFCESRIPELLLTTGYFVDLELISRELVDLLLSHGVGKAKYQLVWHPANAAEELTSGSFSLWETLLLNILEELDGRKHDGYWDLLHETPMFEVIIDHTETLQASSKVAEEITRYGRSRGIPITSFKLSDHFYDILKAGCEGGEHCSGDEGYDESTSTISDCPCEEAKDLRETIHGILEALEYRETQARSQNEQHVD